MYHSLIAQQRQVARVFWGTSRTDCLLPMFTGEEARKLGIAEEREQALRSTALSRLDILNALANNRARPWYEKYLLPAVVEGWHSRYDDL